MFPIHVRAWARMLPVAAGLLIGSMSVLQAQADGTFDPSFAQGTGFAGDVYAMVRQPDGKLVIGGNQLSLYNGTAVPSVVRLGADGALDGTFDAGSGPDGWIHDLALQTDGKVLVAGTFSNFNGLSSRRLVRLMPNGSVDTGFNIGTAANDWVTSVVVQPDGKILIAGHFDQFNGTAAGGVARLLPDGTLDPAFNAGTGADQEVNVIVLRPDGRILLGGYFTTFSGATRNKVVQLNADGSLDASFDPGAGGGSSASVRAMVLAPDGKVLCGGNFWDWSGSTANGAVRLLTDGSPDPAFDASATSEYGITDIRLQPDGNILLSGTMGLKRVTTTGAVDPAFSTGTGFFGGLQVVVSLLLLLDGRIMAGGQFNEYDGNAVGSIVRITGANVGMDEEAVARLRAWPNPTSGTVQVAMEQGTPPAALVVLDPLGRIVQRLDPGRGITTVELPPAPGVYMLEARYATGAVVRMPVVRR